MQFKPKSGFGKFLSPKKCQNNSSLVYSIKGQVEQHVFYSGYRDIVWQESSRNWVASDKLNEKHEKKQKELSLYRERGPSEKETEKRPNTVFP